MKIIAGNEIINNVYVHEERDFVERTPGSMQMDDRPVRRLSLSAGLTDAHLAALIANDWTIEDESGVQTIHKGFSQLLRYEVVFAGHDPESEDEGKLAEVLDALSDAQALGFAGLYPPLTGSGLPVPAAARRQFNGKLYRAKVELWDKTDNWPDALPEMWVKITQSGGVDDWVQPTSAVDAYSFGDIRAHVGKVWRSTVAGERTNTWEPGVYGWEEAA